MPRLPHAHVSSCALLALHALSSAAAQERPSLRGYRLGISFQQARASRFPCQPVYERLRCDAPDSVQLFFERDTLTGVTVTFGIRPVAARERWFAISDSLIALYGEPDSVTVRDEVLAGTPSTTLRALWGPLTRSQPWGFSYDAMQLTGDNVASLASLSLAACFWPDQAPLCGVVLKRPAVKRTSPDKRP